MELGGPMAHHKGFQTNPILSRINPIPRIDIYLFKVHSNIVWEIKSRRLMWADHVARMESKVGKLKILKGKPTGKSHL